MQIIPRGSISDDIINERLAPIEAEAEQIVLAKMHYDKQLQQIQAKRARVLGIAEILGGNRGVFNNPLFNESSCVIQMLRAIRQVILNLVVQVIIALLMIGIILNIL
jgi:hypothetical protein